MRQAPASRGLHTVSIAPACASCLSSSTRQLQDLSPSKGKKNVFFCEGKALGAQQSAFCRSDGKGRGDAIAIKGRGGEEEEMVRILIKLH